MGHRTVKRVPLDFDHPQGDIWPGYIRQGREFPHCPGCRHGRNETVMDRLFPSSPRDASTGLSREAFAIDNTFYAHQIGGPMAEVLAWGDKLGQAEVDMLFAERRVGHDRWDRVELPEPHEINEYGHPIRRTSIRNDKPAPTAAEVNAGQHHGGFSGHDAINRYLLVKFRCERLGIAVECPTCKGRCVIATDEEYEAEERADEAWKPTEPPTGDGWQLWETVSEGSPSSPVFATSAELADWCAENSSPFGRLRWTRDQWLRFIDADNVDVMSLGVTVGGGPLTTLGTEADTRAMEG